MLTSEKVILQTPARHELIDKEPLLIFETVANELDEILVRQCSKVIHFSLQIKEQHVRKDAEMARNNKRI